MPGNWKSLPVEVQTQILKEHTLLPHLMGQRGQVDRALRNMKVCTSWDAILRHLVPRIIPLDLLMQMNLQKFTQDAIEIAAVQKDGVLARAGAKEKMSEGGSREFELLIAKLSGDIISLVAHGFTSCVRMLLEKVPELSELEDLGCALLHTLASAPKRVGCGQLEVLKLLLEEDWILGAIEEPDTEGDTPLAAAISNKQYEVVEILMDHGAHIGVRPSWNHGHPFEYFATGNCRLLTFATINQDATLLKLLLKKGLKPESEENSEEDGHLCIALKINNLEIVQILLDHGASVKFDINQRMQPIPTAVDRFVSAPIMMLLERGADINASDQSDRDGLMAAISSGIEKPFDFLLDHGAKLQPKHLEHSVGSSLHFADRILDLLGPKVAVPALHAACYRGKDEFVQLFLRRGVDPKSESPDPDMNFLEAAVESRNIDSVKILLKAGVDIKASQGHIDGNALCRSIRVPTEEIFDILLATGADINAKTGQYENVLNSAVAAGSESIVRKLLVSGADVNKKGDIFGTALSTAISLNKSAELRDLLKSWGALQMHEV